MHVHFGIVLDHLDRMTDSTGLIQHAIYTVPRRESGYTTDDNARALRLCTRLWGHHQDDRLLARVTTYLSFLEFARNFRGGFHNFLSYDRRWLDAEGCGDCQGQAVRSLAQVLGSDLPDDYRALARDLIDTVLPTLTDLRSLRAQAYVVMAWAHLWDQQVPDIEPLENVAWLAAKRLVESYERSQRPDWPWFEARMTYANAVLPHALFLAGQRWPTEPFLRTAQATFAFLDEATTGAEVFWPVGSGGWYPHDGEKALYDQQPVEAATMADAALAAFDALNEEKYLTIFRRAHGWFRGANSLRQSVGDIRTGTCYDGLQPLGLNRNQGAESTLAFLDAELHNYEVQQNACDPRVAATVHA